MDLVSCPGCQQRDAEIADLQRRVAELEARLGTNATNSGTPPSANPPGAPKPVTKRRIGKKPGGQPGHPAHLRRRLPPERVDKVVTFVPKRCERCQEPLSPHPRAGDPEPTWHQVAELPKMAAEVTEYQGHFRTCPRCGQIDHAPIPADLKAHGVGPRFAATLAYFTGTHRLSKRGLEEITADVFDAPLSLGTVAQLEARMNEALAPAHAEAVAAVRAADVKKVIVGATSGNPQVKVYDGQSIANGSFQPANPDNSLLDQFFAFNSFNANVGVSVAAADFEGTGTLDILTGSTKGPGHYRVVKGNATGILPPAVNGIDMVLTDITGGLFVGA